ncbi:unnamed protein product [Caenorhabditis auriculariae]|uniref:Fibropellin-1 n=1 Tax=Caenorhabditis auriculariae TaxID=2777116 RepID=A0A8S1HP71_9PELO|nr:unnamed protein product [Caenorhabditis auriculariae]
MTRKEDDCAESPCALNATCVDLVKDFHCDCPQGFTGKRCQVKVDLCADSPCSHGLCVDSLYSRQCVCDAGWTGENCDVNIDDCAERPCQNGGTCIDEVSGYKCQCAAGYEGVNCQHLVDHCSNSPCRNNASCTNLGPTYHCDCPLGFDGIHCELNIDECGSNKCDLAGTESCRDEVNTFSCYCKPGFTGKLCDVKIDQCADVPCVNDGQCVDMGGTFKCNCKSGWTGLRCEEESGSCTTKPCRNDGFCVNLVADYFCVCPPGVSGKNCETAPNRCVGEPCHNGGVCGDFGSHLECSCPSGFTGKGCEFKTNGCTDRSCRNGGKCLEADGFSSPRRCQCEPGFTGENCEKELDECAAAHCPASATCTDQVGGYVCVCPFNLTGTNCDKQINVNYDLNFFDPVRPSSASYYAPLRIESSAISVAFWVRFDSPFSHANFFTLHPFGNTSTSLLKLASNEVRVSLFSDIPPVEIPLSSSQHLNDGKAGITLGALSVPAFVGSITRVNVWNRVLDFEDEIPLMVLHCQRAEEIFKGLLVRFEGYTNIIGKVERTLRSSCSVDQLKYSPIHHSDVIRVEDCPAEIMMTSHQRETNISWQEPTFVGLNPIVRVEKNLKQGQLFTWGEYDILYVATDNATNQAQCNFKLRVTKVHCADISEPINGLQSCENWGPQLKYKACSIECRDGFEFPRSPAIFYVCGADGEWRPREQQKNAVFRYPQCTKHVPATRLVKVRVAYSASTACTEASKQAFLSKILQAVNAMDKKWKMCSLTDTTGCIGTQARVHCDNDEEVEEAMRLRRELPASSFRVEIEVPVKRTILTDPSSGANTTVHDAIQSEILSHAVLNFEKVLPNGRPDLGTLQIDDEYHCQAGQVVVGDLCVPCAPGTFHSSLTTKCELCPIGEYQPLTARAECFKCPAGQITASEGATSENECKANCPPGHQFDAATSGCVACGFGYFQPVGGSFACLPCGIGKTTLTDRATSEEECRDECPDGEQLSPAGVCQPCDVGTYRSRGEHKKCISCPPGTTTEATSSTRREQCNTPRCKTGQFLVKETKHCQFCPRGTFQNEEQETTCKLCPADHTTAAQGATAESQCYSTNQCQTGEYNCSWHANCIDLPDDNDVPSYECRCKTGYRGNGTHCTDACNDYCLNDGVCKKNALGSVECVCKEYFSGDRCELRQQQKMQKMTMLGVAIGALVTVAILVAIIIFMIYTRFTQVHDVDEKSSQLHDMTPSTFLYGSPTIREPSRPVDGPFYYEDDCGYEGGKNGSATVRSRLPTSGSMHSTTAPMNLMEESRMEQRLRAVQQHMYHPNSNNE